MSDKRHVFISYSRRDDYFVESLYRDLIDAGVPAWIDKDKLAPGTPNWDRMLKEALGNAYAVIYVVSPNSYASDYVQGEIAIAQSYSCEIYPLWISGDRWGDCVPINMARWQYIDSHEDHKKALGILVAALKGKKPEYAAPTRIVTTPRTTTVRNPYKGLSAFKEDDAVDFFGRETLTKSLLESLETRISKGEPRFLAVVGASGGGKSSVVMAGLLPKLRANGMKILRIVPGKRPLENLADRIVWELKLSPNSVNDYLWQADGRGLYRMLKKSDKVLVFVDQFEELFTLTDGEDERRQFISLLTTAATEVDGALTLILTMRADYFDRPLNYPALSELFEKHTSLIKPLSLTELVDAIEKPATKAGLTFEAGLVAEIVFQLRDKTESLSGALPLLQFTLERLYEMREGNTLTCKAYNRIGGVQGAIGNYADTVFATLDQESQEALPRVVARLVNVDETNITRRRALLSEFTDNVTTKHLLDTLINARLLTSDISYVEVAHEALIINWRQFAETIQKNKEGLRQLRRLQLDAQEWERQGMPKRYPRWTNEQLKPLYSLCENLGIILNPVTAEFARPEAERLLEDYRTAADYRRKAIIDQWVEIGEDATMPLTVALKDNDRDIRCTAVEALGEIGAIVPLITALKDKEWRVEKKAIEVLRKLGDVAITPLIASLKDKRVRVRQMVIEALGKIGDVAAVAPLIDMLADENNVIRQAAIEALGKIGDVAAVAPLIDMLADENNVMRQAAIQALGKIAAVAPLIDMLADENNVMRKPAIQALGYVKDVAAVAPLINMLADEDNVIRQAAIQALGKIGDVAAVAPLIDMLEREDSAAWALGEIGDAGIAPLIDMLGNRDYLTRQTAIKALGKIGNVAVAPLVATLKNKDDRLRDKVARILGKIGIPTLASIIDGGKHVRHRAALEILENMDTWEAVEAMRKWREENEDKE